MTDLKAEAEHRLAGLMDSGIVREVRATTAQIERVTTPQIHVFLRAEGPDLADHQAEITRLLGDLDARLDVQPVADRG